MRLSADRLALGLDQPAGGRGQGDGKADAARTQLRESVRDQQLHRRAGREAGGERGANVVVEGLQGGEQIIVEGLQSVRPGQPVQASPVTTTLKSELD